MKITRAGERELKKDFKQQETDRYKKETGKNPDVKGRTKIVTEFTRGCHHDPKDDETVSLIEANHILEQTSMTVAEAKQYVDKHTGNGNKVWVFSHVKVPNVS